MLFQFMLPKLSKSERFSCLQKVDHVTNYCKRPISLIFPANQEEVMSSSMEKQTVALSGSAGNQWNEMDWKTQTNEFYIIKGRQNSQGSDSVSVVFQISLIRIILRVNLWFSWRPSLNQHWKIDRCLARERALHLGDIVKTTRACWIWDDYSHLISRQLISTQPHIHTHIIHPANSYPLVEQLLKRCEN